MYIANPCEWPTQMRIAFYNGRGQFQWQTSGRGFDLCDELMLWWEKSSRTIYMGLNIKCDGWSIWDEETLSTVERLIRYDISFDGYRVTIKRVATKRRAKCTEEFLWKLVVREAISDSPRSE